MSTPPVALPRIKLEKVSELAHMIVTAPKMPLGDWMIMGRQVATGWGGVIDLLAIDANGSVILIQLEREIADRSAVATVLNYASWLQNSSLCELEAIYGIFSSGRSLLDDAAERFGAFVSTINPASNPQLAIVALDFAPDASRTISYLVSRGVMITRIQYWLFEIDNHRLVTFKTL